MKKLCFLFVTMWCILFCAGCGQQEVYKEGDGQGTPTDTGPAGAAGSASGQAEYYDIYAESKTVFAWEESAEGSPLSDSGMRFCGMQFYQGEPVQFWEKFSLQRYGMMAALLWMSAV